MPDQPQYNPDIHHRHSLRLQEYDYAQKGAYFATVCAQNRMRLFGEIIDGAMQLSAMGVIVQDVWTKTQEHYSGITLDAYVIMPNHFHGIIIVGAGYSRPLPEPSRTDGMVDTISNACQNQRGREDRKEGRDDPAPTVGNIVVYFKYQSTKQINALRNAGFQKLWQRNYYDHVIRDDDDLIRIHEYIDNNTANWLQDELFA